MVRNIPNRYNAEELLCEIITRGFTRKVDFLYLPIDFATKRSRGYAFINLLSVAIARAFVECFHDAVLPLYATNKVLVVDVAHVQGLDANIRAYMKDGMRVLNTWFRPMVFSEDDAQWPV